MLDAIRLNSPAQIARISAALLVGLLFISCGGSSSETPFPAPPVPEYVKQRSRGTVVQAADRKEQPKAEASKQPAEASKQPAEASK